LIEQKILRTRSGGALKVGENPLWRLWFLPPRTTFWGKQKPVEKRGNGRGVKYRGSEEMAWDGWIAAHRCSGSGWIAFYNAICVKPPFASIRGRGTCSDMRKKYYKKIIIKYVCKNNWFNATMIKNRRREIFSLTVNILKSPTSLRIKKQQLKIRINLVGWRLGDRDQNRYTPRVNDVEEEGC